MKRFFGKVAEHIDRLDADSVRGQYKGLAGEFAFLEAVLGAMCEGVIAVDRHGALAYANPAAEKLAHFDFSAAKGEPAGKILPGWGFDELIEPPGETGWTHAAVREIEITYPERKTVEIRAMPGGDGCTVLMLRDTTSERAREESALESGRMEAIQQLASGVAHEIGNPLNALSLNLDLLARDLEKNRDAVTPERLAEDVGTARREVRRIDAINRGFLAALRPVRPVFAPGSIADPLKDVLAEMRRRFEDRDIRVILDLPTALPTVLFDAAQIRQVFFNLVKNALEAMKDGGELSISIEATDSSVEIVFGDNGSGIPAEDIAGIFEPYRTTKGEKGNGLGLLVCRRIVRAHGGEIDVASREGEGTRFTVRLPRMEKRIRRLA